MTLESFSLPQPDKHRTRGQARASRRGLWRSAALIGVHLLALIHIAHWKLNGSSLSPLEPSEAQATLELGYVNAGFVLLVLLILVTLVVGRFFCGWACHVVAYQDASAWLLGKLGLRPRPVRSRLLMLLPGLAAFDMFLLPTLMRWFSGGSLPAWELRFSTHELWETFPGPWIAGLTFFVDGMLLVWFLGAKGFCTYGCPYGALFGIAERAAPGRIRVTDACEGCGHCTAVCTSNVSVHSEVARFGQVLNPGCMRCMDCVSACPKQALYFGFKANLKRPRAAPKRPRRSWDFSWPEELALGLIALLGVFAFRGLYQRVPLMLALGLGVLLAASTVALMRMFRAGEMRLQHLTLRSAGRWTHAGLWTAGCLVVFLALGVHSLAVRSALRYGVWLVERADALLPSERAGDLTRAGHMLSFAADYGLMRDVELDYHQGLVALGQGDYAVARDWLLRATEQAPNLRSPQLALAEASLKLRDLVQAELSLQSLLALDPTHQRGRWRLAQLRIMQRDFVAAEALLEALLRDAPQHAQARQDWERVQQVLGR